MPPAADMVMSTQEFLQNSSSFFFPNGDCKPMTSNKSFGAPLEELPSEASNLASLGAEIWSPDGNWETAGVSNCALKATKI